MTRENLSIAGEIRIGAVVHEGYLMDNTPGLVSSLARKLHLYGAISAALSTGIINGAASAELPNTETVEYTADGDGTGPQDASTRPTKVTMSIGGVDTAVLDLGTPRNLVTVVTHGSSVVAMTVVHYGYDDYGHAVTETHAVTATGTTKTVTGKKAIRYWRRTTITAAGNAEANTLNLGTGNVIGLPFRIDDKNQVTPKVDGFEDSSATVVVADTNTATSTTGDTRGTVTFNSAPNGTARQAVDITVMNTDTSVGAFGVAQA